MYSGMWRWKIEMLRLNNAPNHVAFTQTAQKNIHIISTLNNYVALSSSPLPLCNLDKAHHQTIITLWQNSIGNKFQAEKPTELKLENEFGGRMMHIKFIWLDHNGPWRNLPEWQWDTLCICVFWNKIQSNVFQICERRSIKFNWRTQQHNFIPQNKGILSDDIFQFYIDIHIYIFIWRTINLCLMCTT